jgi:hypothetical protein
MDRSIGMKCDRPLEETDMAKSTNEATDSSTGAGKAKGTNKVTIEELEERVRFAELRAREAEAEVRFLEANAKRVVLKADRRTLVKKNRGAKKEKKSRKNAGQVTAGSDE